MKIKQKEVTLADYGQIKRYSYDEVMNPEKKLEIEKCLNLFEVCERNSIDTIKYGYFQKEAKVEAKIKEAD